MANEYEISAPQLKGRLDAGDLRFIFDLRARDEFAAWRIEGRQEVETLNIPQAEFLGEEEKYLDQLPGDREIIAICAHGGASRYEAEQLREKGFNILSLAGGMDSWSEFYQTRRVARGPDIFQVERVAKGCLSHVIVAGGEAVVIDAVRHLERIKTILLEQEAALKGVIDTHLQADHISGGRQLAEEFQVPYYISPIDAEQAAYRYTPLTDNLTIRAGASRIRAIHSPGHTPGSFSLLLDDRYLFTGDIIMKSGLGRPDLGGMATAWAHLLYRTIFDRFAALPDTLTLLPSHATGIKEEDRQGIVRLTLGDFRRAEPFNLREEPAFIDYIEASLPENPARYQDIRRVNLGLLEPDEEKRKELEIGKNLCGMVNG